jgi:Skp family chaperone for outer membrane proteins
MEEFEILTKEQIKKMKRVFILGLLLWLGTSLYAQTTEQERNAIISERKAVSKMTEKAIEARVTKTAKKEAKRLQKQGWQPGPGTLPIQKQLDNSYRKRVEMEGTTPK